MHRGTKIVIVLIVAASLFAGVTLYVESSLREAFQRRLLVVRATNTLSTDAPPEAGIPADFGPHCVKASFAQSGALIVDADVIPTDAIGVVYEHAEVRREVGKIRDGLAALKAKRGGPHVKEIEELNRHGVFTIQFLWDHFRKEKTSLFQTARETLSAGELAALGRSLTSSPSDRGPSPR